MKALKALPGNLICGEMTTHNDFKIYFSHYVRVDLFPIRNDKKDFYYMSMGNTGEFKNMVTMHNKLINLTGGDFSFDSIIKDVKSRETDYDIVVKIITMDELPTYVADAFNCYQYKGMHEKFNMSEVNLYTKIFKQ